MRTAGLVWDCSRENDHGRGPHQRCHEHWRDFGREVLGDFEAQSHVEPPEVERLAEIPSFVVGGQFGRVVYVNAQSAIHIELGQPRTRPAANIQH